MASEKGAVGHAEVAFAEGPMDTDTDFAGRIGCEAEVNAEGDMVGAEVIDMATT